MKLYSIYIVIFLFIVNIVLIYLSTNFRGSTLGIYFLAISIIQLVISIFFHIAISKTWESQIKRFFAHAIIIWILFFVFLFLYLAIFAYIFKGSAWDDWVAMFLWFFVAGFVSSIIAIILFIRNKSTIESQDDSTWVIEQFDIKKYNSWYLIVWAIFLTIILGPIIGVISIIIIWIVIKLSNKVPEKEKIYTEKKETKKINKWVLILGIFIFIFTVFGFNYNSTIENISVTINNNLCSYAIWDGESRCVWWYAKRTNTPKLCWEIDKENVAICYFQIASMYRDTKVCEYITDEIDNSQMSREKCIDSARFY